MTPFSRSSPRSLHLPVLRHPIRWLRLWVEVARDLRHLDRAEHPEHLLELVAPKDRRA